MEDGTALPVRFPDSSALSAEFVVLESSLGGASVGKKALDGLGNFLQQALAYRWSVEVAGVGANHLTETAQVKEGGVQSRLGGLVTVRLWNAFEERAQA